MVEVFIDGAKYECEEGKTILEVAKKNGIYIPTLCYLEEVTPTGACRLCVVEVEGTPRPQPACVTKVTNGMKVQTNTRKLRRIRRTLLELLIANHPNDCLYCVRSGSCDLQTLSTIYGVRDHRYLGAKRDYPLDVSSMAIVRDPNKCILCERCVKVCDEVQSVHAIDLINRGYKTTVSSAFQKAIHNSNCVLCGQCIRVCPTGALKENSASAEVQDALNNDELVTVVQVAPSISVTIGEEFGLEPGTDVSGKLVTALKRLGFQYVFDTVFGADLTIMEEANEFVKRFLSGKNLPLITSCSPGWIKFLETEFPDLIPNLSTCKSPMSMQSAIIKTYWAKQKNISPKDIYSVAIMPCVAKKFEAERPEMVNDGIQNTDAVLTTRELVRMIRTAGLNLATLPDTPYDDPLGEMTGAGKIFGTSGGVGEAALRTAYWIVNKQNPPNPNFEFARGSDPIKRFSIEIKPGVTVNGVITSGLGNARKICEEIRDGNKNNIHFVEVMACPNGCINGGGQPVGRNLDALTKRMMALYCIDGQMVKRYSHENESVLKLYKEFLGEPGSKTSHHLLHTKYYTRKEEEE